MSDTSAAGEAVDHADGLVPPSAPAPEISVRTILFGSGPRFARDAFGPVLVFYVGWRLGGLLVRMVAATAASLAAYWYERRHERPGNMARLALFIVGVQVLVGLTSGSAAAFLAPPVIVNAAFGLVFLVSALMGRPLAGVFAAEFYDFPPEVRTSETFRRVMGNMSLGWAAYLLGRSAIRLIALLGSGVDAFVMVNLVTGFPVMALMISWSVWYGVRGFRRSEEWGWAFAAEGQA